VSATAAMDVEVLNIAGRRVAQVCQGRPCEAGPVSLSWNGRSATGTRLPSGQYLVRITGRTEDGQQASAVAPLWIAP